MRETVLITAVAVAWGMWGCDCGGAVDEKAHFQSEVVPVLESHCAAGVCHGIDPAGRLVGEEIDDGWLFYVDEGGEVIDWQQTRKTTLEYVNAREAPDFSTLIRKPLPEVYGGIVHAGESNFTSPDDPGLEALRRWIELEEKGGEDPQPPDLNRREQHFASEVLPHLVGRNCAAANCHGRQAFNDFLLDPGIPDPQGGTRFGTEMIRDNYESAHRFLTLDGVSTESQLIKKGLPLDRGGITHRGGNRTFFTSNDDPAVEAIAGWADMERRASHGDAGRTDGALRGVVYLKGPVAAKSPFDVSSQQPGTDLYFRSFDESEGTESRNLTAHLHDGDADIRDPAVSYDGTRVAFSMRTDPRDHYDLFELDLETGRVDRRTEGGGADVMATWGADGSLYFASTRHGERFGGESIPLALYRLPDGADDREPKRLTFGPGSVINPRYFRVGKLRDHLVVAQRRGLGEDDETVGFEFPVDLGADYHIYFGATAPEDHFLVFEEMPDGRALSIVGDPDNRWSGGKLAIVDRNLGPETGGGPPATFAATEAFRDLDPSVRSSGVSYGGVYRDPAALPDGSVLVAWAPGPVDLGDRRADPRFRILHLTIDEAPDGCTTIECLPRVGTTAEWLRADEEHLSVYSPRPVVARKTTHDNEPRIEPREPTTLELADVTVNQGIIDNLFAAGPKYFRDDVRYVRLVEALSVTGASVPSKMPNTGHPPAAILGEVELERDGSAYLQIPPETPVRLQLLDDNRMAVGPQHSRWLFVWPGQAFPASVDRHNYDVACGGCHGASSGDPEDLFPTTDAFTGASATLAEFEDRNPRRKREPVVLDAETRRQVTFEGDIQPIFDLRCNDAGCHAAGSEPAGGLALESTPGDRFSASYEAVVAKGDGSGGNRKYVDVANTSARTSFLVEVAADRSFDADRPLFDHPAEPLSQSELKELIRWIETGASFGADDGETQPGGAAP